MNERRDKDRMEAALLEEQRLKKLDALRRNRDSSTSKWGVYDDVPSYEREQYRKHCNSATSVKESIEEFFIQRQNRD